MKRLSVLATAATLLATPILADGHATGDAEAGERAFRQCISCHVVVDAEGETLAGRNGRTGPNLWGIHGRQIRFIVEDHAYQMPKAMQGLNKLVNSDKIFAMFLQLGTPMNMAAFKLMEKKQIHNVFPLTGARQMIDPLRDYKWAGFSSYYDQINQGLTWLAENKGAKNICAMFIPFRY